MTFFLLVELSLLSWVLYRMEMFWRHCHYTNYVVLLFAYTVSRDMWNIFEFRPRESVTQDHYRWFADFFRYPPVVAWVTHSLAVISLGPVYNDAIVEQMWRHYQSVIATLLGMFSTYEFDSRPYRQQTGIGKESWSERFLANSSVKLYEMMGSRSDRNLSWTLLDHGDRDICWTVLAYGYRDLCWT
jgi:hypothetical protein